MRDAAAPPVRLADYAPPPFLIDTVDLDFSLDPDATMVRAVSRVRRNPAAAPGQPLVLDGEGLETLAVLVDGAAPAPDTLVIEDNRLVLARAPETFTLEVVTRLAPRANSRLEGLYMSSGRYCTQCEAQGFRRITWFLDRPDVMARYRVRIEAPIEGFPSLLSNGDLIEQGQAGQGRHFAVWHDPWPKPAYLFALCAGAYDIIEDTFVTRSGRTVALAIHVDHGEGPRALYAMDALKRAMHFDERVFGREYDLDVFNIVAVRDFNFGAMENKGLNIFNSAYVLADAETATDADFANIESVVAHEYFHNWTGNRITLRDWFQLCLKEGLTVFRDQEFSADQRSAAVQRIKDVRQLRFRQFPEDAGPLAHAVRPQQYAEIDNFYTATIYEKGAEIIRMLRALIGEAAFAAGMDLFFTRCDGMAATVEDFLACFAEASGQDLTAFARWYAQPGTPRVTAHAHHDAETGRLTMTLSQSNPHAPATGTSPQPVPIPLRIGFTGPRGETLAAWRSGETAARTEHLVVLDTSEARIEFEKLPGQPVAAIGRGFSAPVLIDDGLSDAQRLVLMAHDEDAFTRWDQGQRLAVGLIVGAARGEAGDASTRARFIDALGVELERAGRDPAFAALVLRLPEMGDLLQAAPGSDPEALFTALAALELAIAERHARSLEPLARDGEDAPFVPDAAGAGRRALRASALALLAARGPAAGPDLLERFHASRSMTDTIAALEALGASGAAQFETALEAFLARWSGTALVVDKWFAVQAAAQRPDAVERVEGLLGHPLFDPANPNRVRAVAASFVTRNVRGFHRGDGAGYRLLTGLVGRLDGTNPMVAARVLSPMGSFRQVDPARQALALEALRSLATRTELSLNSRDIVERMVTG
jgi:aminopeptidase N